MTGWVRRYWQWLIGPVLVGAAALAGWFVDTGSFLVMPGDAVNTSSMVSIAQAPKKANAGRLLLVTIYSAPANADEWLFGHVYPNAQLVPAQTQLPPNTTYEHFRHIEEAMMADSQTTAKLVALRTLGYDVPVHGQGAVLNNVARGSAGAQAGLQRGDLITAVNGQPIETDAQLVTLIGTMKPGQSVALDLKPNNSDDQRELNVTLGAREDQPDRPLLGVVPSTYRPSYDFPVQVNIDSKGIIGPSAGLVLTLSIIQALSSTDITHGHNVAATGTVDMQGNVGPIGGIEDKVLAAEGHADYFFVPKQDYDAAAKQAKGIQLVEVDTVQQAMDFLAKLA